MIKLSLRKKLLMAHGPAVLQVEAELQAGITAVYGHSGAGKTTLLKMIAGLVQPDEGVIEVNGKTWLNTRRGIRLPVQQRHIGFVFQDGALFPHMTVAENLRFALLPGQDASRITQLLQLIQMEQLANSRPGQLSGGQQQRVALVRALIRSPQVLLMDEPLASLDNDMRTQLRTAIAAVQQQFNPVSLLVTHDLAELHQLAANVLHLHEGNIIGSGTPARVFEQALPNEVQLTGTIVSLTPSGNRYELLLQTGTQQQIITISAAQAAALQPGSTITLYAKTIDAVIKTV